MRIAMLGQKGIPAKYGGIERHVEELSKELVKSGQVVLVYARAWYTPRLRPAGFAGQAREYQGIQIIHTPGIHTKNLDAVTHTFTATLHAIWRNVDIYHYHGVGPALLSWLPRLLRPRAKVIVTFHCIDRYHQKWGAFARAMLHLGEWAACKFAHQTITVSKTLYHYCVNEYFCNTVYIPNGVETITDADANELNQFNLTPDQYIATVTRLVRHKGVHYLIRAYQAAKLIRPELFSGIKLVVVGDSVFTDNYVRSLYKLAGNDHDIIFTGWQQQSALDALYSHALLYVHPSENEGLSLSVLRAMSAGKPILVSDIAENRELISDHRFWFENTDVASLTNKLIELMANPKLRAEAGGYNRCQSLKYNWPDIARQTAALYASDCATNLAVTPHQA